MKGKNDHLKLVEKNKNAQPGWKKAFRFVGKLVIVVVIVLLLKEGEQFFRVNTITVDGTIDVSVADLAEAGGINKGRSIFLLNEDKITERIKTEYPSVKSIKISRTLPDQVSIIVEQRYPAAYIVTADGYWLIDTNVVPYKNISEPLEEYPEISGISGELVVPGFVLNCKLRKEILHEFFSTWHKKDSFPVEKLDLSESYNLIVYTADNLEIWFGNAKNMEQKLELVKLSLPQISDELEGARIDVRSGKRLVVSSAAVLEKREVDP